MSVSVPMRCVRSRESFILGTTSMEAAITKRGAMLAPVTFFRDEPRPIQPYAVLPWSEEALPDDTPALISGLRGDFMCSAFGANEEPFAGQRLPLHGETTTAAWEPVDYCSNAEGSTLTLRADLPLQGGHCLATTMLREGHSIVYQRHTFTGIQGGAINPGHHAILELPESEGAARLSFSPQLFAHTLFEPGESPAARGYSWLKPAQRFADLTAAPCIDGSCTDLTRYPARRGYDDVVLIVARPDLPLAWSAVAVPSAGYVWFSLRNPAQLASTLLWSSNGGRHYPPWNGRCVNVLGVEDITGFFHIGLAASASDNPLSALGVITSLPIAPTEQMCIPYIQGVARIGPEFDRVTGVSIRRPGELTLTSEAGSAVHLACDVDFLHRQDS